MEFAHYEILRKLATGGMAELFLARQKSVAGFQRNVVVKRILSEFSDDKSFVESFLNEARLAAQLNHPNIVQIYDLGLAGKSYFIAMEYIKGFDLSTIIRTCKRRDLTIPIDVGLTITADVLSALNYAHEATDLDNSPLGIVHRDVSPSNVLVTVEGQAKVVDFGIAKATAQREKVDRTSAGTVKGKVAYLSPEQVLGTDIDRRVDVFAAGIVCHEVLTLQNPFRGETDYVTLRNIVEVLPPRVDAVRPEVPTAIADVVHRALAADPTARFSSCAQFLAALEVAAQASGVSLSHSLTRDFIAERNAEFAELQADSEINESTSSEVSVGDLIGGGSLAGPTLVDDEEAISTSLSAAAISPAMPSFTSHAPAAGAPPKSFRPYIIGAVLALVAAVIVVFAVLGARASFAPATPTAAAPPSAATPEAAPIQEATPTPTVAASKAPSAASTPTAVEEKPKAETSAKRTRTPAKAIAKAAGPPGRLRFSVLPWAEVEVDGQVVGVTPMKVLELSPGPHRVVLRNSELNKSATIKAEVVSGKEIVLRRNLAE